LIARLVKLFVHRERATQIGAISEPAIERHAGEQQIGLEVWHVIQQPALAAREKPVSQSFDGNLLDEAVLRGGVPRAHQPLRAPGRGHCSPHGEAGLGNGKMVACDKLPVEPGRTVAADLSFEVEGGGRAMYSLKIITL
jgi:hypothetical protein